MKEYQGEKEINNKTSGQQLKRPTCSTITSPIQFPHHIIFQIMEIQEDKTTFYRPRWELKIKGSPHPSRRWCHTTTLHAGFLYIMGGRLSESAKTRDFVYRVNCQTFLCEPVLLEGNPMMRESHSSGLVGDSMHVLFGINKAGEVLKDCLSLKIESNSLVWRKKNQTTQIEARQSHMSLVLDNRYILIYGGIDQDQKLISDFYLYDLERQTWKKIEQVEGSIQGKVGGTLINIKNQIYLFGGQITDQNQYSNSIYKIQILNYKEPHQTPSIIATKLNISGINPLPRSQFASVAFKDRYLIIFGGQGPNKQGPQPAKLLGDIWSFDTEKQVWEEIVPQNSNIFKPRSSFTANVYKDSVIIFGGLVAFKDFRSTDEIFVLNLSTETEKKPLCNLCKSSFKMLPNQDIQIEKGKAVKTYPNFNTGFSTISAIANTIQDPFSALGTLLQSFDPFNIERCAISLNQSKLMISLKNAAISNDDWRHILNFYEFIPLIQERDQRVTSALRSEIRQNQLNYLSYNIKNCCLRLGNELLITWLNENKELQLFLMNKFGVYHTMNVKVEQKCTPSQRSIILQHLKEQNIRIVDLYQNSMTLCVTSLRNNSLWAKELAFCTKSNDIVHKDRNFKDYMKIAFSQTLSFDLGVFQTQEPRAEDQYFRVCPIEKDKWPLENNFPELFEEVSTFEKEGKSLLLIYQNNKLMHETKIDKTKDTVIEFHLTKIIEPNLTFSDVQPTEKLFNAIKTVISKLCTENSISLKRGRSLETEKLVSSMEKDQVEIAEPKVKKAVKTNESENVIDVDIEFEINIDEEKTG